MIRRYTHPRPKIRPAGFTLVELLVVMAILTVVVSGVVAVFLGSMKAIRQGYRHMDAYEMSRGAFQVMDRDLTGGFTSRDHGDYYSFYGAPYGMTFVGLASNFQGIGNDDQTNLTRVSYVIRQLGPLVDSASGLPVRDAGGNLISDPRNFIRNSEGQDLPVYVLIRYVERNADNLDAFRYISWTGAPQGVDLSELPPEWGQQWLNLAGEYQAAEDWAQLNNLSAQAIERFKDAKKRELFLRMLRGNGPVWIPDANDVLQPHPIPATFQFPDYFDLLRGFDMGQGRPITQLQDYVVATNIYFSPEEVLAALQHEAAVLNTTVSDPNIGLLYFGIRPFDYGLALGTVSGTTLAQAQQSLDALLPAQSITQFSKLDRVGNYFVAMSPFWNSGYMLNLASHPVQYGPVYSGLEWFGGEGSPLLPRIPSVVHVHLHLRFPAPNIAAADIERVLDQMIDIPTGYSRAQMGIG